MKPKSVLYLGWSFASGAPPFAFAVLDAIIWCNGKLDGSRLNKVVGLTLVTSILQLIFFSQSNTSLHMLFRFGGLDSFLSTTISEKICRGAVRAWWSQRMCVIYFRTFEGLK
jgi:hypothetical protein